jgi:hypothetical protein
MREKERKNEISFAVAANPHRLRKREKDREPVEKLFFDAIH